MYKLVILIHESSQSESINEGWPQFLHLAEQMPRLQKEVTSRADYHISGDRVLLMHELYFDSEEEAAAALNSTAGIAAGEFLQKITGGSVTVFLAAHQEDTVANLTGPGSSGREAGP